MSYQQHGFSETDLSRFREVQRLAYQCTVEISHDLTEGVTEIEACACVRRCCPYPRRIEGSGRLEREAWPRVKPCPRVPFESS